jgi:hypothetical protein
LRIQEVLPLKDAFVDLVDGPGVAQIPHREDSGPEQLLVRGTAVTVVNLATFREVVDRHAV